MAKSQSYKPEIITRLFEKRWDPATKQLRNPMVTSSEVREEYLAYCERHGMEVVNTNPPAFMKDFLRKRGSANKNWPTSIFNEGYTARQVTGLGRNFEFIPVLPGQKEPFPSTAPEPPPDMIPHAISSVSLPLTSRRMGRPDEPWLVQVSVRLHVVETYFALFSARRATVRQVDHLQNTVKLNKTEIDALFLGSEEIEPDTFQEFMVTCEAKRVGEDIISEQVLQQAKAVFSLANITQSYVIPVALKAIGPSRIHLVEYAAVTREEALTIEALSIVNHALFELVPPVPGIGAKYARAKTAKAKTAKAKTTKKSQKRKR